MYKSFLKSLLYVGNFVFFFSKEISNLKKIISLDCRMPPWKLEEVSYFEENSLGLTKVDRQAGDELC